MGEGNHAMSASQPPEPRSRGRNIRSAFGQNRMAVVLSGAAVAVLASGIVFQLFRAENTTAAEQQQQQQQAAAQAQPAAAAQGKQQMARVGEYVITYDMVAAESVRRIGPEVLDNIINRTIIMQACKEKGVSVSAAEVNQEIATIAEKFKLPVDTWYQMLQAERKLSPDQYQRDVIWPMLALRKLAGEEVQVTAADMQKAFIRDYGPKVECKVIVLNNDRRAQEVWEKAQKKPEDFGRMAREYSIEPTSRALEGSIPPIAKYAGPEKVWERAFKLRPGEISGIIQVDVNQYIILMCEGHIEPAVSDINEVKDILYEHLVEEKRQEAVAKVFEQLKTNTRVDNYLTHSSSGGVKQTSATNAGTEGSAGVTKIGDAPRPAAATPAQPR